MVARQCEIQKREPRSGEEVRILAAEPRLDPQTHDAVMLVVECWFDCSGDRALGFGATGDISSLAVRAWAASVGDDGDDGLDKEATRLLVRTIRCVDAWRSEREAERRRTENM